MLGLLTFLDPPRPDTKQTIEDARSYKVAVKMITGDHMLIAKETARALNMGDNILSSTGLPVLDPITKEKPPNLKAKYGPMCLAADGFAQVFPEHKYLIVETLRELGYKVGMTGDGVNDAPALKRADVGIAVSGATDAARAAADIVLTEEGLSTIVHGIVIARCIFVRIRNFITYRISATLQLLVFFFISVFAFKPSDYQSDWPSFFHMPVIMLMLITLLNDGTLIAIGYDNVVASREPEKWNLRVLFSLGCVLGGVACLSSLLLLYALLDSYEAGGFFQATGMGGISYGQITTAIYLKVSISDFLTLFSSRTGDDWFWSSRPAPILFGAAAFALTTSTILACVWPASTIDGVDTEGLAYHTPYYLAALIWLYCIIWWFIQVNQYIATNSEVNF
jgi:H+-transporting ATPase